MNNENGDTRYYDIRIDGQQFRILDPEPTGRYLLSLVNKTPDDFLLTLVIKGEPHRLVDPDETVDVSGPGIEDFDLVTKERYYSFRIDERSFSLPNRRPTGAELLKMVDLAPETHQISFQIVGQSDVFIEGDEQADLGQPGREQFWTEVRKPLTITIDGIKYRPGKAQLTGTELRHLPVPPLPDDAKLWLDVSGPDDRLLDATDTIKLQDGMMFYSVVARDLVLTVVVGGASTDVKVGLEASLYDVARKALEQTKNEGRSVEDWEFNDREGHELVFSRLAKEFAAGVPLFLNLKAGANG